MHKILHILKAKMLPVLTLVIFIGVSASFSIAAAQKVWGTFSLSTNTQTVKDGLRAKTAKAVEKEEKKLKVLPNKIENKTNNNDPEKSFVIAQQTEVALANTRANQNAQSNTLNQNNNIQTQNVQVQSTTNASGKTFTVAELATHNVSGNCYVAYKGTVYNVSNVSAWAGCKHHGAVGGKDITSVFPHPTSYFNSLPVVGVMASTATSTNPSTNSGSIPNTNIQTNNTEQKHWEEEDDDDEDGNDDDDNDNDEDSKRFREFEDED